MANSSKTLDCRVGTAHQSRLCHCERSEAISLHYSLFLVRNSIFTATFAFLLLLFLISPQAHAKYGGGTGEPNDPYLIFDANQMNAIGADANDWDKCFKLIADIDLSAFIGTSFNIIGTDWDNPFAGIFDGNDHTVSNFTYDSNDRSKTGLFGYIDDPNAEIKNLGLFDPNVDAGTGIYVGSLVGRLGDGIVTNCYVEGGSVSGDNVVGGLVGYNYHGTITNCYSTGSVSGNRNVGGLVGCSYRGTISNCYSTGRVSGNGSVGGLVGRNTRRGTITNCYSTGVIEGYSDVGGLVGLNHSAVTITNCYATGGISGETNVGGLIGSNSYRGSISNCYATGSVSGNYTVGGLVGYIDRGTITNSYSTGSVLGDLWVGGLVGINDRGTITNCRSIGDAQGNEYVGGLVGVNRYGTIANCYSVGSVYGYDWVGGLVGYIDRGTITNCYSTGSVSGTGWYVGGLVGHDYSGVYTSSFWDNTVNPLLTGIGNVVDPNVIGESTANMQTEITFTDAGWDFNTPVWTIEEGVDYPRLRWETPLMHAEPDVTLGTSNTISWEPVVGAHNEYYAECAADANFTSIVHSSGWITETTYEFNGLQLGQRYWYSVKARNAAGVETNWSNVESSLQCTLADAVDIELAPESLKNENLKGALLNKINVVLEMIDEGLYENALNKLENDILQKMNGCGEAGQPDKNDWIITCEEQSQIYPLVIETIAHIRSLMQERLN